MPVLSVIVPIYNEEQYLDQCLESIRVQTFDDFEVLCINDGSTDTSCALARTYSENDTRFTVHEKQNGGYGSAVNLGLERAKGDYVAIVEPDDFIHPRMFETLLSYWEYGGKAADIIKGTYWLYFDACDGFDERLDEALLTQYMPKEPGLVSLRQNPTLFGCHPSIWSALYRREFLQQESIRMREAPGAGWVDNPFLAETLVKAHRIVWVPQPLYYYRQTTSKASNTLADFRIPFDRTNEMAQVLQQANASDDMWALLYMRQFDYIHSVIGEYGYHERDKGVATCIYDALAAMDPAIVHTHPRMRASDASYYDSFMAAWPFFEFDNERSSSNREVIPDNHSTTHRASGDACAADAESASFIVAVQDDADVLEDNIRALLAVAIDSVEVLCIDCGSTDRSMALCRMLQAHDSRVHVLDGVFSTFAGGVNAALQLVRGRWTSVTDMRLRANPSSIAAVLRACDAADAIVFDATGGHYIDAEQASGEPLRKLSDDAAVSCTFNIADASSWLISCLPAANTTTVFRTDYLKSISVPENDSSGVAFQVTACVKAKTAVYAIGTFWQETTITDWTVRHYQDPLKATLKEPALVSPALLQAGPQLASTYPAHTAALQDVVIQAFLRDMDSRRTYEAKQALFNDYFDKVADFVSNLSGRACLSTDAFDEFQLLRAQGLESYLAYRQIIRDRDARMLQAELEALQNSKSVLMGKRIGRLVNAALPRRALSTLRSRITPGL